MSDHVRAKTRLFARLGFCALGVAVLGAVAPAQAEEGRIYASAGVGLVAFSIDDIDIRLGDLQARVGYQATPHFGFEVEGALPFHDEKIEAGASSLIIRKDSSIAGFVVGRSPINDNLSILGRIGYRQSQFSTEGRSPGDPVTGQSASDGGVVLGVGAEYDIGASSLRGEYARTDQGTPFRVVDHVDEFSISIVRNF